jgi:hypothetical protein
MMEKAVTTKDLANARQAFEKNEPRDLFYRAATELVQLALDGTTTLTVAEAIAVLLQTWNRAFYQYRRFDSKHFSELEGVLALHATPLAELRLQAIDELDERLDSRIKGIFTDFEAVLGPVGAAKCLHLMSSRLFPLWDRRIAEEYRLALGPSGTNAERYWRFMLISREQIRSLRVEGDHSPSLLKALDEFNYCHYTKGWI